MTTATVADARAQRQESHTRFYVWMSAACMAVAVLGFMPSYFLPMARGAFHAEPIVHIHGILLFSWVTFLFVQSWLVGRGRVLDHRTWGMLGVSLMTAIAAVVVAVIAIRMAQANLPGQPPGAVTAIRAFSWVTIGALLFIVPCFVLAIVWVRDSETHKRLMLLLTIAMLGAPIARWFLIMAPAPDPNAPPWPAGLPPLGAPPMFVPLAASLLGDILLVIAIARDWRTLGKAHPVYLYGGGALLLLHVTTIPVAQSTAWLAVAEALGRLGTSY